MTSRMIPVLRILAFTALIVPASAEAQLGRTVDAGGRLFLHQGLGGVSIVERGVAEPIDLPAGVDFKELTRLEGGWVATGTQPGEEGADLLILARFHGRVEILPSPVGGDVRERMFPVPFVDRGRLVGVAWLEGESVETFEVRVAEWSPEGWSESLVVSPRAPGSQIAPAAAVLADGSWLLIWSAYDGEDTDIHWSIRRNGEWTRPARLHADNAVPDIVPALTVSGEGALAAWSNFDGSDYRLRTARFDGRQWLAGDYVGGPGTLFPRFSRSEGALAVLFKHAVPAAWTLLELAEDGMPLRELTVSDDSGVRPLVEGRTDAGVILEWPAADLEAPGRRAAGAWQPPQ